MMNLFMCLLFTWNDDESSLRFSAERLTVFPHFSGKYNIFVGGKQVGAYDGHGSFGELALMYNMPRAATIQVILLCRAPLQVTL